MAKILKWNQFMITEIFNNQKLVKNYSTRISEEIRRISPSAKFRDTLTIVNLKEEECVEVEKILKSSRNHYNIYKIIKIFVKSNKSY